jgi:hypothetical protein
VDRRAAPSLAGVFAGLMLVWRRAGVYVALIDAPQIAAFARLFPAARRTTPPAFPVASNGRGVP